MKRIICTNAHTITFALLSSLLQYLAIWDMHCIHNIWATRVWASQRTLNTPGPISIHRQFRMSHIWPARWRASPSVCWCWRISSIAPMRISSGGWRWASTAPSPSSPLSSIWSTRWPGSWWRSAAKLWHSSCCTIWVCRKKSVCVEQLSEKIYAKTVKMRKNLRMKWHHWTALKPLLMQSGRRRAKFNWIKCEFSAAKWYLRQKYK